MDKALEAATLAYDEARCKAHGGDQPMSERNRETIAPMIEAAVHAYLAAALPATDTSGLVERLRLEAKDYRDAGQDDPFEQEIFDASADLFDDAADRIEALERENAAKGARLAEADAVMRPFANVADHLTKSAYGPAWGFNGAVIEHEQFRAARSYLEGRK